MELSEHSLWEPTSAVPNSAFSLEEGEEYRGSHASVTTQTDIPVYQKVHWT